MANLKALLVEDAADGQRGYFVDEQWALERLPELAKQLDELVNREGTPPAKLGIRAVRMPADRDHRGGVMLLMYPPTQLRDASLEAIRMVRYGRDPQPADAPQSRVRHVRATDRGGGGR